MKRIILIMLTLACAGGCGVGKELGRRAYLTAKYRVVRIPTENMLPTIQMDDLAAVDENYYSNRPVERFDLIIFQHPQFDEITGEKDTTYLKRVIALGGERVEIRQGKVYVDGAELGQPFPFVPHDPEEDFAPIVVPEGEFFLLGDNRPNSADSRHWKRPTLGRSHIRGKVVEIIPQ